MFERICYGLQMMMEQAGEQPYHFLYFMKMDMITFLCMMVDGMSGSCMMTIRYRLVIRQVMSVFTQQLENFLQEKQQNKTKQRV